MLVSFRHGLEAIRREKNIAAATGLAEDDGLVRANWLVSNNEVDISGGGGEEVAVLCEAVTIELEGEIKNA